MGTIRVTVELGHPEGARFEPIEALVDTGASYSWVPAPTLALLGIAPTRRFPFVLADGRRIEKDMAETRIRLDGQEQTTWVVFGDADSQPLLGAYTMEGFGLAADPVNRRLMAVPGLLMSMSGPF
ncbi:MAG: hypothetical protein HW416_3541 [Chloroflexi bacterium]|nr:hypothetical protein [Chloroflexota bacterium]